MTNDADGWFTSRALLASARRVLGRRHLSTLLRRSAYGAPLTALRKDNDSQPSGRPAYVSTIHVYSWVGTASATERESAATERESLAA
jgi:hypothetical protein